jgi:hypothetical protein
MKHTYLPALRTFMVLFLAGCLAIVGCKEDTSGPDTNGPRGFILKAGGAEKAKMTTAGVTGSLQIDRGLGAGGRGVPSDELELTLTLADGSVYTPQATDSLEIETAPTGLLGVQRIAGSQFRFYLLGKGAGSATVIFRLLRGQEVIFNSNPVPVTIVTQGLEVTKLRAVGPSSAIATVTDTVIQGSLNASSLGAARTITVELYNAQDDQIFFFNDSTIQVTAQIADTNLATVERDPVDPSSFNVIGKQAGHTTINFTVTHVGTGAGDTYVAFKTPEIGLDVL